MIEKIDELPEESFIQVLLEDNRVTKIQSDKVGSKAPVFYTTMVFEDGTVIEDADVYSDKERTKKVETVEELKNFIDNRGSLEIAIDAPDMLVGVSMMIRAIPTYSIEQANESEDIVTASAWLVSVEAYAHLFGLKTETEEQVYLRFTESTSPMSLATLASNLSTLQE